MTIARTRMLVVALLAAGVFFSVAGSGLAISGFADQDQAAVAQYGQGVLPDDDAEPGPDDEQAVPPGGGSGDDVRTPEQVQQGVTQAGGGQLPFTGFSAIPVLLAGVAALTAGLVLRRRSDPGTA
jgi:hypothetical protein